VSARSNLGLVGRSWATASIVVTVVIANAAAVGLWKNATAGTPVFEDTAYGLPALREGRWWTFLTGMFFARQFALAVVVLVVVAATAIVYERRVGHLRTLLIIVGGQFAATFATALLLWPFDDGRWAWADDLGHRLDLGISAGGLALAGALTAVVQPVWRHRARVGIWAYLIAMVLNSGQLWDVEHLVGFTVGAIAGPFLIGRMPRRPQLRFGPRTQRATVALVVASFAVTALVEGLLPGNGGPFHFDAPAQASSGLTLSLVISSLLLVVSADSLRRGRRIGWAFVTTLTAITFVVVLAADASAERTADLVLYGAQLVLLAVTVRAFSARSGQQAIRRAGLRLAHVVAVLFVYTAIGFSVMQDEFTPVARPAEMITEFLSRLVFVSSGNIEPTTTAARWFIGSIGAVWLTVVAATIAGLLYSSRRPLPAREQDERLRVLLRQHHSSNIGWMLTWRGITVWFTADGRTAIGYKVVGSVALCLADPVGPIAEREAALRDFDGYCFEHGWVPCLFAAGQPSADIAPLLGWKAIQVAEDSVIRLDHLEFTGKPWQTVRTALHKAEREGITLVATTWAESKPVVTDQLRAISGGWVSGKALPEMGFTLGTLREADDPDVRLHLAVDADQTIEGFTSWMPVADNGQVIGWTLDLMRRRDRGFRPVMEFLIATSALRFKDDGYQFVSLSAAPLANAPAELREKSDQQLLQKILDFLARTLEPYYGFQSLFAFKQKFQPEHQPMYLVFPDETALAEIGVAIARAYMPDAKLLDWFRIAYDGVSR
jgi:phosphatidylglycerol lysyltransferase